jgi:molybdopterin molybdotransferase
MLSLEDARLKIVSAAAPLPSEFAGIGFALGRFVAEPIRAPIDIPRFDNSAMDGYAVRSIDLQAASSDNPATLVNVGNIPAGKSIQHELTPGQCVRIFTGSPLPSGADAVVMQEDTERTGDKVLFREPARPLENVRLKGEDVKNGTVILEAGQRINPARLGLLSACGIASVPVIRKPVVALVATGSELREAGAELAPGEIYESNRVLLAGLLEGIAEVKVYPIVPDDLSKSIEILREAFASADVVISSGGVSVGEFDYVKEAFTKLGGRIDLWRIAIRPGKPFVYGLLDGKFLFGLPGNPVSAMVSFLLLVRPAILKLAGSQMLDLPILPGELTREIANSSDRRHFMRVRWRDGKVYTTGPQASHMIGLLGESNGLLDVPPKSQIPSGSIVPVQLWQLSEL